VDPVSAVPAIASALAATLAVITIAGTLPPRRLPCAGGTGHGAGTRSSARQPWTERVGEVLSAAAGDHLGRLADRDAGRAWAGAVLLGPAAAAMVSPVIALVLLLVLVATPMVASRRRSSLRLAAIEAQVPLALDRVAGALRAGASLHGAIWEAAQHTPDPVGADLRRIARDADRGRPLGAAIAGWVEGGPPAVQLAGAALSLGAEAGGGMARAVDGVAATVRERRELAAEARSLATQARASAALLAVAPLLFALLVGTADAAAARFLLGSPLGAACLVVGLGLEVVGLAWMARITRSARPAGTPRGDR
jgi:Flp pilus assembly protein TadB